MKYTLSELPDKIREQIDREIENIKEEPAQALYDFMKPAVIYFIIFSALLLAEQEITYCEWTSAVSGETMMYDKMRNVFNELNDNLKECSGTKEGRIYSFEGDIKNACAGYNLVCEYDLGSTYRSLTGEFDGKR